MLVTHYKKGSSLRDSEASSKPLNTQTTKPQLPYISKLFDRRAQHVALLHIGEDVLAQSRLPFAVCGVRGSGLHR